MEIPRIPDPDDRRKPHNGNGGSHEQVPDDLIPPDLMEKFIGMIAEGLGPFFAHVYDVNDIARHMREEGAVGSNDDLEKLILSMPVPKLADIVNKMVVSDKISPERAQSFLIGHLDSLVDNGKLNREEGQHLLMESLIPLFDNWDKLEPS